MKTSKKVLSTAVLAAITIEATSHFSSGFGTSIDTFMLKDVHDTVEAIDIDAMPAPTSYKLVGDTMVKMYRDMFKDCDFNITSATLGNKFTQVRLALVEALEMKARKASALQAALEAEITAQEHPTKANQRKSVSANKAQDKADTDELSSSLDKAAKAGRKVTARKLSGVTGFNAPKKATTRKPKPDTSEEKAANAKRIADRELILQALDNVVEVHDRGDKATARQRDNALGGVAHVAALIVGYLPEDMRTL